MKRSTLRECLKLLASVKRNVIVDDQHVEAAWFSALADISDEDGKRGFAALTRTLIIGDVEPGHVVQAIEALEEKKQQARLTNRAHGEHPWISEAPKFQGVRWEQESDGGVGIPTAEFKAWLSTEQPKRYRAVRTETNEIVLIQNPEAWAWKVSGGQITYLRPRAIETGEKKPRVKKAYA